MKSFIIFVDNDVLIKIKSTYLKNNLILFCLSIIKITLLNYYCTTVLTLDNKRFRYTVSKCGEGSWSVSDWCSQVLK